MKKTLLRLVESSNRDFKQLYSCFNTFFVGVKNDGTRGKIVPVDHLGNKIWNTWELSTVIKVENTDYTLTIHTRNSVYVFLKVGSVEV